MLAIGRMNLAAFIPCPQHRYLLRLVDAPDVPPPFPDHHLVVSRGPFTVNADMALMQTHRVELIVAKNSGGSGAQAKILAARQLGLPVLMIDRPVLPQRDEVGAVAAVFDWLAHSETDRGV
jgi:precorrin-6A/cobalt-precorrin-6A reductase